MYLRIGLFVLISIASILIGILPATSWVQRAFNHSGFYFICTAFFLWCCLGVNQYGQRSIAIIREHYRGLLLSLAVVLLIFIQAPPRFKVLADETNLVGVSMSMYQDKTVSIPISGFPIDYGYPHYHSQLDKRPLLFPFLIAIVHSLIGYNLYNGFMVNFLGAVCLLFALYLFIQQFLPKFYGLLAILMAAALPNFVMWGTSSGFEIINTLFVVITFMAFHQFIRKQEVTQAEFLFLTLLLVANCRYESIVLTVITIGIIPFFITKKLIKQFSAITFIMPLLFIPTLWQRVLTSHSAAASMIKENTQLIGGDHFINLFSFHNFWPHASKSIYILLGLDPNYGFSPVVSLLAVMGLYLGSKHFYLNFKKLKQEIVYLVLLAVLSLMGLTVILFSYRWGDFMLPDMNRVAMVFIPYLVFGAIYTIHTVATYNLRFGRPIYLVIFSFHLLLFWPYGFAQRLANTMELPYEYNHVLAYLSSEFKQDHLLIISDHPNLFIIDNYGSVDFAYLAENKGRILKELNTNYDHVLIFQRLLHGSDTPHPNNELIAGLPLRFLTTIKGSVRTYLKVYELGARK